MASHEKFVRFYHAYRAGMASVYLEKILDREGDINDYIIPYSSSLCSEESELIGSTILHFVLKCRCDINIFAILLKRGANFTIKNVKGSTVLHLLMEKELSNYANTLHSENFDTDYFATPMGKFVNLILKTHVTSGNFTNPIDNNGISHFHVACMMDNCKAVEFFLLNGVAVEHAVNKDSKVFAGYTSMHLAVERCAYSTAKLLLKYGANINDQNTNGITPLNLLLMQRLKIMDVRNGQMYFGSRLPSIEINENLMNLFLEYCNPNDFIDNSGLSYLHVICTSSDLMKVEQALHHTDDIDHYVDQKSVLWPGYTALHFAAHCNVNTVKLLINKGASIDVKSHQRKTPLDLCLERFKIENVHKILSNHPFWKDMLMSDGKTKFTDLVYSMRSFTTLKKCLGQHDDNVDLSIPLDSPSGPGCTVLHLAVLFLANTTKDLYSRAEYDQPKDLDLSVLQGLLNHGANVVLQDAHGQTPVHIAFRLGNMRAVNLLLEFHHSTENPVDQDNLSHLHIACAAQNHAVAKNLVTNKIDVNSSVLSAFKWYSINADNQRDHFFFISTGSTALHICVANNSWNLAKLLLNHGADVCSKDANGLTPIHRVLTLRCRSGDLSRVLLNSPTLMECIEERTKLSHLHVASFAGHMSSVRRLLDLGGDADMAISREIIRDSCELENYNDPSYEPLSFVAKYYGFTPFHLAVVEKNKKVAKLLLKRGSDTFLKNSNRSNPFLCSVSGYYNAYAMDILQTTLWMDHCMQERFKNSIGLTLLHLACGKFDATFVKKILAAGANVNARIHNQSCVWAGCTPLHVLMIDSDHAYFGHSSVVIRNYNKRQTNIDVILSLLLEYGADVTLSNAANDTPLNMKKSTSTHTTSQNSSRLILMLKSQKNFKVNPVNEEGISHFHIACRVKEPEIVREFLKNGVDVNQSIGEFSYDCPSFTSLHLATSNQIHNIKPSNTFQRPCADIDAVGDFADTTPVYTSLRLFKSNRTINLQTINLLLKGGADANAKDAFDNTPLHLACHFQITDIRSLFKKFLHALLEYAPFILLMQ